MRVSDFMIKKEEVISCRPDDPLSTVAELFLKHQISCVLVIGHEDKPTGIVTKTDIIRCFAKGDGLETKVATIMNTELQAVTDTMSRDEAAENFKPNQHHAIVVNSDYEFVGLISALDIVTEVAAESKTWPWFRTFKKLNKVTPDGD